MDHATAVQAKMGEKYLLGELSASQEDEFAGHFFDCEECSTDLRMTSLFLETTKKVLAEDRAHKPAASARGWSGGWQSARYAIAASVALFAFTVYQNTVTIPTLRQALAPQALEYFSLNSLGSRSASQTVITPPSGRPFVLLLDIPPQQDASGYRAQILSSAGTQLLTINVSAEMARKTVPLLVPASTLKPGDYWLVLSSRSANGASFTEFERQQIAAK